MLILIYAYLVMMFAAIIFSLILWLKLQKSRYKLPEKWQHDVSFTHFRLGIFFLMMHFLADFVCEIIAVYLANHGIYNNYVLCINISLNAPFLFGFFFIHTQALWNRYIFAGLYGVLIAYFLITGCYDPRSVSTGTFPILMSIILFLAALLHLTYLLLNPQSPDFNFQMKVSVILLVHSLLTSVITSFYWVDVPGVAIISILHISTLLLYPLAFAFISIQETFRLHRTT